MLADFSPPDMYLARGHISGQYHEVSATGAVQKTTNLDTDAMLTYASVQDAARSLVMLTQISSYKKPLFSNSPMFIPLALKKSDPIKFGYYIAQQNTFLQDHRNIAIVGVVPELMDLANSAGNTLWNSIHNLPGVYRCDPCARTPDLGKWNISSAGTANTNIKEWLSGNLPKFLAIAPAAIPKITTFPAPEILSKDRRASAQMSISSGLIDASPLDDYMRSLDNSFALANPPPLVTRHPWKSQTPVESIDYSFDLEQFPTLLKDKQLNTDNTRTTIAETLTAASGRNPATAVSATTEDFVSTVVRTRMTAFETANSTQVAEFQSRLATLDATIANIHSTVNALSSKMAGAVLTLLTSPDGILTKQDVTLNAHNVTINRLLDMMGTLTSDVQRISKATEAMAAKPAPTSPIHKRHCPGNCDEDSIYEDSMQQDNEDSTEHGNPAGIQ
jgi:hypothetical protein